MSPASPETWARLGNLDAVGAAVKAWESCGPVDGCLNEVSLVALLPVIAAHIPGGTSTPEHSRRLAQLFRGSPPSLYGTDPLSHCRAFRVSSGPQGRTPFMEALRAHNGKVHFPFFWRAFSGAVRIVTGSVQGEVHGEASVCDILAGELDAFREDVLHVLEDILAASGQWALPAVAFLNAVRRSRATSQVPGFWRKAEMLQITGPKTLGLEAVGLLMLTCLRNAISLLQGFPMTTCTDSAPSSSSTDAVALSDSNSGMPVYLNIYDVSHKDSVQWLNAVFAHWLAPVKFGGAFHAGVEVHALEWSFGATRRESVPGVTCILPRSDPQHHFRQTIYLGRTQLPIEKMVSIITDVIEEYPGSAYDVLRLNCCHFADDFCKRLGVGPIPSWVHRLARLGAGADGAVQAVFGTSSSQLLPAASFRALSALPDNATTIIGGEKVPVCLVTAEPVVWTENATTLGPL